MLRYLFLFFVVMLTPLPNCQAFEIATFDDMMSWEYGKGTFPCFVTYGSFYRSLKDSSQIWKQKYKEKHLDCIMNGDIREEIHEEVPFENEYDSIDWFGRYYLLLIAYKSGNIRCAEFIYRKGLCTESCFKTSLLTHEVKTMKRPDAIALFLVYEQIKEKEISSIFSLIRENCTPKQINEIILYSSLYSALSVYTHCSDRFGTIFNKESKSEAFNHSPFPFIEKDDVMKDHLLLE